MKIIQSLPPNINKIKAVLTPHESAVFAYNGAIYNPSGVHLPRHLEVHEEVHIIQQGDMCDKWWDKYLSDPKFRFKQEIEAHHAQYKFIKATTADREKVIFLVHFYAIALSGPMYGNLCTFSEATRAIKYGKI
jgi:hypothetical protein